MKILGKIKSKVARWFLVTFSLSTAVFIFQACYGIPNDYGDNFLIEGIVLSGTTSKPIDGIKVSVENIPYHDDITSNGGLFSIYVPAESIYRLQFSDIDSIQNGNYATKDTVLMEIPEFLNIVLDEK
ncbi:MAG: hypothetical protein LBV41_03260 [Cytophagaceae bacterium]|jgi:hypothetical protein|nr:hypothetical protein [Cytophagaceae bacterium]